MISSDAKEKSVEVAAPGIEAFGLADQGHENLLGYVFGDGCAAAHVQGEAINRGMLFAIEMREGIFVSRPHPAEQAIIRWVAGLRHHLVIVDRPLGVSLCIPRGAGNSS